MILSSFARVIAHFHMVGWGANSRKVGSSNHNLVRDNSGLKSSCVTYVHDIFRIKF